MKAHVVGGRIVVDEPVDMPEGTELYIVQVPPDDDMTDEERAKLEAALDEGMDDADAGRVVSEAEVRAMLRALR